ncbi:retrovirus-related pol polyprotein from transposon TNT 1-94 [Tanacetum coccineum]|uniref:Retrovirus-related pol polyprotein from transposon TNT 1-94 n=1 Tax=Tanacetum coccineum TaxID=301880 RepID=A0ABQ4ZBM4_9ASTR
MLTQQDISTASSENRPPMLNKENYVPWSSRLLRYAKSRPNGKLICNFIINGPYVKRMIPKLDDTARAVPVLETFHEQTDDELTAAKIKQIEADDQAIQTILLGLPEDIYAAVDSCETAQEIWLRVKQMMKGSDIRIQEKKAKLFNEWERFTSTDGESIESYYHRKRGFHPKRLARIRRIFLDGYGVLVFRIVIFKISSFKLQKANLKFLNNLQPEWSRHDTIVHQTKDLHTADYTQLYDFLKYNQKEVDDLRAERLTKTQDPLALMAISNNPFNYLVFHPDQPSPNCSTGYEYGLRQTDADVPNVRNQVVQNAVQNLGVQNVGNQNGLIVVSGIVNQNPNGNGNVVAGRAEGNAIGNNGNQIRCYNCKGLGHLARNCIVRLRRMDVAYLQTQLLIAQKEKAGIQLQAEEFDLMAVAADLDEIEEVNANCILMANLQKASTSGTQTDKAPVYDSDGSAECGTTVEQHLVTVEETRAYHESLFHNLAAEVENVNSVNRKMKDINANLTTELARYKNQEKCFEISQEKYDKLERCYQKSVYQEQCLTKNINALHLSSGKQIMALNEEISNLNRHLSKEKATVSSLQEEKKRLKSDFKIREDEFLDKQIQLENKIKELDIILVKTGQSIQTMHMLSPKPDSFYHTKQKMALGKHDPPDMYDSEETLELVQESCLKMRQLNKEIKLANYTKINHLLWVFVSQTAKSREELYFSNTSKTANVSKSISIPNEELSDDTTPSVARKFLNEHKALELEIKRLLRAVVSHDIMSIVQNNSVIDTSNLQTELEHTKERFENSYNDMQQKIKRLQAQLGDPKGKSKDTPCVSDTLDPLPQKLENENVELEYRVRNYEKENAHLKTAYKNLFDSIIVTRAQTKMIIDSLQNKLHDTIYENAKLRAQLFDKVSKQKDTTKVLQKVDKTNDLSNAVTLNLVPTTKELNVIDNDKVIAPGMFRINPFKNSMEEKYVPNKPTKASVRTNSITVSQPHVITKKVVIYNSNGFSSTGVDITTKTRRPQPMSNTKNDRVPYASKSSRIKNKEVEVEEHPKNLLLSKNKKHVSSECNNVKLAIWNDKSEIVYAMCKQCLIIANHDMCVLNYVNGMNSRGKKQKANVSNLANQMKHMPQVKKPKKVGFTKRLASPTPSKPSMCLRWSPTGRIFDLCGKLIRSSDSECYPNIFMFLGTVCFGNDHVVVILGFSDLQWGNILITRVYFIEHLGHNLFSVGQFYDSDLEVAFRINACFVRNLEGVNLLKVNRTTNLYTINLHDMASTSPICLMARATSTTSWLWLQRLSQLNFDTINDLPRNDLVIGLLKFKYHTEHLCPSCEQGKGKRASHPPKPVLNSKKRLHLLHMDLCGQMRIASINGKWYVLVIVDDYSRYTWVLYLRSKDKASEEIKTFLKKITVLLQAPVIIVRTNNGTKFKNQVLQEYFNSVGISHQASSVRTHQQNRVVEQRNSTLVEAARTMLIFSRAPKSDISFLYVFGALYYPKNDREDIGKLGAKAPQVLQTPTTTTTTADTAPTPKNSSSQATSILSTSQNVDELETQQQHVQHQPATIADNVLNAMFDDNTFVNPFVTLSTSAAESSSLQYVDPSNMHTFYQPYLHEYQWTKDPPLEQVIGEPSRLVLIMNQLRSDGDMCMYALTVSTM